MFLRRESKSLSIQISHSAHGDACCQSNQTKKHQPEVIVTTTKTFCSGVNTKIFTAKVLPWPKVCGNKTKPPVSKFLRFLSLPVSLFSQQHLRKLLKSALECIALL